MANAPASCFAKDQGDDGQTMLECIVPQLARSGFVYAINGANNGMFRFISLDVKTLTGWNGNTIIAQGQDLYSHWNNAPRPTG